MPVSRGLYYFASEGDNYARPPIVLIHGAGGHHLYWPPQVRRLQGQRMLALDLPGHGKSSGTGHQTIEGYAGEVAEFIQSIGLSTAVLVGHSMGGAIALEMASPEPEACSWTWPARHRGQAARRSGNPARPRPTQPASLRQWPYLANCPSLPKRASRLKTLAAARMRETRPSVLHGDFLACDAFDMTAAPCRHRCANRHSLRGGRQDDPARVLGVLAGPHPRGKPRYSAECRSHGHVGAARRGCRTIELFVNSIQYRPGA